jgi:hypothetical protein
MQMEEDGLLNKQIHIVESSGSMLDYQFLSGSEVALLFWLEEEEVD